MIRWKPQLAVGAAAAVLCLAGFYLSPASGAVTGVGNLPHPATGVDSCTLKNTDPKLAVRDATKLPLGKRPQTYRPDNFDCDGAEFAKPGVQFARFPRPKNFHIVNRRVIRPVRVCQSGVCRGQMQPVLQPARVSDPLAPYFRPPEWSRRYPSCCWPPSYTSRPSAASRTPGDWRCGASLPSCMR